MSQDWATDCSDTEDVENNLEDIAGNIANIFIIANNNMIPVKRNDLVKTIPKGNSRKFAAIIRTASELLEEAFGYKIVEIDGKKSYILVNQVEECKEIQKEVLKISPTLKDVTINILRTNILISIFMSGGMVQEGTLKEYLRKFGVDFEPKMKHPILGDVHKLVLTDFVRQGYIEINDRKELENAPKEYSWGSRANLEMDKKKLLEFVAKVYGDHCRSEMFTEQWNAVNQTSAEDE